MITMVAAQFKGPAEEKSKSYQHICHTDILNVVLLP
jgi:hypothetical protein